MPLFAPPCSPAPGKGRKESLSIAGRRPPSQRVRKPLSDLNFRNRLVDAPPDARDGVLKKAAIQRLVDQAEEGKTEVVPQRRANRGAGRYVGGETVRSSQVQGLKRVGLRQFEGKLSTVQGQPFKCRQSGRDVVVPRPADGECEAGAGPHSRSCRPGEHFGDNEVVGVAADAEALLVTCGGFRTPGDSEGDDEEGDGCMPVVTVTSSPEFVRKPKGSPAGGRCFAAGPFVGSGGNGGTVVRDRRKCKPRGVLIVGAEKSLPSSPDDNKEDGNEKVPKRSVASVEWMVADEVREWGSCSEVHTSAVDMSVTFQTRWESIDRDSFDNEGNDSLTEAGWGQLQRMHDSLVMADAEVGDDPLADKPLELQEYQMLRADGEERPTEHVMQGCSGACFYEEGDQVNLNGDCCAVGTSAHRIPLPGIKELHITEEQEKASSSSDNLGNLAPLQCSSPQVKGRSLCGRVKTRSDLESDIVLGACESINPGITPLMTSTSYLPKRSVEADLGSSGNTTLPSGANLLADGLSSRNGYGTIRHFRNSATESPERGPRIQMYVVPTNSPESLDVVAVRSCAYGKRHVKAGCLIGDAGSSKAEEPRGHEDGGIDTAQQGRPLSCMRPSKYGDCLFSRFQDSCPYMTNGPLTDGPTDLHQCRNGKVHDGLPSAILRKNKICKEKDMVRTLEALTHKKEASRLIGQKMGSVVPRALLGNRVRSLSGLLNSQEVRDELRSEDNSKLFKKKYPRRQPGADIPRVLDNCNTKDTTSLSKSRHPPDSSVGHTEGGAIQAMEQGELGAITTAVEPGWKAFRTAQCKMKVKPRGQPRYETYTATVQEDAYSESAGLLPPSRSTATTSFPLKSDEHRVPDCRVLSKQQENLLRLSLHISHSLENGGHSGQDDPSQMEEKTSDCPGSGWWKKRVESNRLDVLMQYRVPAISGALLLLNAALITYIFSRISRQRKCR